jgi:hypothetical protein
MKTKSFDMELITMKIICGVIELPFQGACSSAGKTQGAALG